MQAGTETIDWAGTPVTNFWYDDYANVSGYNNKAKPVYTPVIHQGDSVYVEATYNGNNTMTVFYQNYTTTNSTNMTVQTLDVDQSSADSSMSRNQRNGISRTLGLFPTMVTRGVRGAATMR